MAHNAYIQILAVSIIQPTASIHLTQLHRMWPRKCQFYKDKFHL